jgi:hypothetical protein
MVKDIFKLYTCTDLPKEENRYSYFGGDGNGPYTWDSVLLGYKNAGDALFEKFKSSEGNYAKTDTLVYPICFVFRQIVELSIKFLYLKFSASSDTEKKEFLDNNHELFKEWKILKPILSRLKKEVTTDVSINDIEQYVVEMNKFDCSSMRMRYPVNKNLKPTNGEKRWIDIYHIHEAIDNFYDLIKQLDYDLERKVEISSDEKAMKDFVNKYRQKRNCIIQFIDLLSKVKKSNNSNGISINDISTFKIPIEYKAIHNLYNTFDDDTKIILECLFYGGREILTEINLPPSPGMKILTAATLCINQMKMDQMKFGSSLKKGQTNILGKKASSIIENCNEMMKYLDNFKL